MIRIDKLTASTSNAIFLEFVKRRRSDDYDFPIF
jgi:hypothetical protein